MGEDGPSFLSLRGTGPGGGSSRDTKSFASLDELAVVLHHQGVEGGEVGLVDEDGLDDQGVPVPLLDMAGDGNELHTVESKF